MLSKRCSVGLLRNPRDAGTLQPNPRQATAVLAGLSVTVLESQSLPNRDPPRQDLLHSFPPRWPWTFVLTLLGTEGTDWGQEKESPVMVGQPRPLFMCPLSTIACTLGVSRLWKRLGKIFLVLHRGSQARGNLGKQWASGFCLFLLKALWFHSLFISHQPNHQSVEDPCHSTCSPFCCPYLSSIFCKSEVYEHTYLIVDVRGIIRPSEACSPYLTMSFSCPILGQESLFSAASCTPPCPSINLPSSCAGSGAHTSLTVLLGEGGVIHIRRKQQ